MKKILIAVLLGLMLTQPGCSNNQPKTQNTPSGGTTNSSQQKVFTLDELKKYNGQNGNPAYVAVDGNVYDVTNSKLWSKGAHQNCSTAGNDLSTVIKSSPHGNKVLKNIPVVGTLKQ